MRICACVPSHGRVASVCRAVAVVDGRRRCVWWLATYVCETLTAYRCGTASTGGQGWVGSANN